MTSETQTLNDVAGVALPDISGLRIVKRLHWGRYFAAAVILVLVAVVIRAFANGQIEWAYVGRFLTVPAIVSGVVNTVIMSVLALALGIIHGVIVTIMRMSPNPVLRSSAAIYVWLFR